MKPVTIETQKKLVLIPVINYFCVFICVYNCLIERKGSAFTIFALLIISYLPFFVLMQICAEHFSQLSKLVELLSAYLPMLLSGFLLIKYQDRLGFL